MTLTRREFIKHSGIAAGVLRRWQHRGEEKGGKILTAGR